MIMALMQRLRLTVPQTVMSVKTRYCSSEGSKNVDVQREGSVCLIGINRPQVKNAVDPQTAKQLQEAFCRFEEDPTLSVAVFYGKGGTFCAGYDLKALSKKDPEKAAESLQPGPMGPSQMLFSKPVIGALSGYAVAGGLEMALLCDMRVADHSTVMGVFNRRFGVPLIDGGTVRLSKIIGMSRALDLVLTGRPVKTEEALMMGLVNRVVPDGTAFEEAMKLAQQLASFPDQEAMRRDRQSTIRNAYTAQSFQEAFSYEFENGIPVLAKESMSGAKRFADGQGRGGSFDDISSKL